MTPDEETPRPANSSRPLSYTCPGELYSIPREIHLARLAAFYFKCHDCEHRFDHGQAIVPPPIQKTTQDRPIVRPSLLTSESVRGVYLNELDRNRALLWGEAFAAVLWERQPMSARALSPERSPMIIEPPVDKSNERASGPKVVVGFDERTSSPDIVRGAVLGLRRMGCPVIDLGQTAYPIWAFHVRQEQAAGGMFVTGAGCGPSVTGFEFLDLGARLIPIELLQRIELLVKQGVGRQTRQIGYYEAEQGMLSYESSLESHFHALRPLRIVCGTSTRMQSRILERVFSKLPCQLTDVSLPTRQRNLFDSGDIDLQRVAQRVVNEQAHLGIVIDEDGSHLALITDQGRLVSPREVARLLVEMAQRDHVAPRFVVSTSWLTDVRKWLEGRAGNVIDGGESAAGLTAMLMDREAQMALSADGRVWFRAEYPVCDAIRLLASILQALSLTDAPFSELITRISRD